MPKPQAIIHFPANIISLRRHWYYRYVRLKVTSYLHHQAPLSQADALRVEFEALREAEQQTSALSALEVRSCWAAARGLLAGKCRQQLFEVVDVGCC